MHKNYFTFEAEDHHELGKKMGSTFKNEAAIAITKNSGSEFEKKMATAAKMLPACREHFPEYVEEIKGYAEGAGIEFPKMWTLAIEDDADIEVEAAKCTSIITNGGKLLVHSEDTWGPGLEDEICVVRKTVNGLTTLEIYYYNTFGGVSVGLNSNGFAVSINTILDKPKQVGIPKGIIARKFLDTRDPVADFGKVKNLKLTDGYNHNIIDINGKITNIELSLNESDISFPRPPFSHTNHCLLLKKTNKIEDVAGTFSRLEKAVKMPPTVSVEELQKIVEDSSLGNDLSINNERTIGRMIIDFENFDCYIWLLRENELGWVKYPIDFIKR